MPTIHEQVAEKLSGISPAVSERVVDTLVEKEVNRRVEMITQGLAKLSDMEREMRKLNKPDVETFNHDGSPANVGFTKQKLDDISKQQQKMDKLTKALDNAIDKGDFGDLNNLVQNKN